MAITGDIREMYHQVRVISNDQHAQRFLWRKSETEELDEYILQVMTFGATCSPSLAQFVKNLNARQFQSTHGRTYEAIVSNHYVDDLLEIIDSAEEAIELASDVKTIHSNAGFEIRIWCSNSTQVLNAICDADECSVLKNMNIDIENQTEKVLGMWWCYTTDHFTYSLKFNKGNQEVLRRERKPTKREILKLLMSI